MEKARECTVPLFIAFLDYKKAFDSVRHSLLWESMAVNGKIVSLLQLLHKDQEAAVGFESDLTDWFTGKKGARQGCLVSPICFNLYMEAEMWDGVDEKAWDGIDEKVGVNNLHFANDILC